MDIATNNPRPSFAPTRWWISSRTAARVCGRQRRRSAPEPDRFELNQGNEPIKMVYAREGVLTPDPANTRLLLKLFNARFEERDKHDPRELTKIRQGIEVNEGACFYFARRVLQEEYLSGRRLKLLYASRVDQLSSGPYWRGGIEASVDFTSASPPRSACLAFALIAVPLRHYSPPQGNICRFSPEPRHRVYLLLSSSSWQTLSATMRRRIRPF